MEGKWQLTAVMAAALLLHTSVVVAASIPFYCKLNEFQCPSKIKQCIQSLELCNGVKDCADGSDENAAFCKSYGCNDTHPISPLSTDPSTQTLRNAKCPSGNMCTNTSVYQGDFYFGTAWLCTGGQKDCADGSDEDPLYCKIRARNCSLNVQGVFDRYLGSVHDTCPSKKYCVEKYRLCDGKKDCPDGSDEWPSFCKNFTCPFPDQVSLRCKDGGCLLSNDQICNGNEDCGDGSDEDPEFCAEYKCPQSRGKKCLDNRTCLRDSDICDGVKTCPDGSDEEPSFCREFKCPGFKYKCKDEVQCAGFLDFDICSDTFSEGFFPYCKDASDADYALCPSPVSSCSGTGDSISCPGGVGCVSKRSLCNGRKDCQDGSDEGEFCKTYDCGYYGSGFVFTGAVMCKTNLTCTFGALCDGFADCADSSDEDPAVCQAYKCPFGSSKCKNFPYQCVSDNYLCDGTKQCINGGDEDKAFCKNFTCPEGLQKCPNFPYQCIDPNSLCDGKKDCRNGGDEDPNFCKAFECTSLQKCPNDPYQCVYPYVFCDGKKDCLKGGDEDPAFCKSYTCPDFSIKCPKSSTYGCVSESNVCDGRNDCSDGSDEDYEFCKNYTCPDGQSKCPNSQTQCINDFSLCDGINNCGDGSDEDPAFCKSYECPAGSVKCPNSTLGTCIYEFSLCDGSATCPDRSDEDPSFCTTYTCPADSYRCKSNPVCLSTYRLCDGRRDCYDGSDEEQDTCDQFKPAPPPFFDAPAGSPGQFFFDDAPAGSPVEFIFEDAPVPFPGDFNFGDAPAMTPGGK